MVASRKRPGEEQLIDTFWAVIGTDQHGDEGIVAQVMPGLGMLPLVFTQKKNLDMMRPKIDDIAKSSGESIEIVEFRRVEKDNADG